MLSLQSALVYTVFMGAVIFLCRAFPFLFFRDKGEGDRNSRGFGLLSLAERVAPPVAMTVLAFNSIAGPLREDPRRFLPTLIASSVTALVHLRKRNPLISIFGGTLLYMVLIRLL
ncbi:MAG: AzlD domain-containing protein [Spirochaetaceae bacterium]|jgi:branched-subunit amino acid transport protein AzlD|nr:AzlD domain-containing protein [Spirochaetaceae bacterium]